MKKKHLCLLLAAMTTVSSCAVAVNAEEPITVTFGRHTTTNPMLPEGATYEDNAYIDFIEQELNIEVVDEFEASNEDYDRQVSLTVSAGAMPDIMKVSTVAELQELYENDMIMDLTDVYEEYANDTLKDMYNSFPEGLGLDRVTIDGQLMAIPAAKGDTAPMICWVRQDWLDQLGITMDEDGDRVVSYLEIIEVAKQFMAADPEGTGNPVGISAIPDLVWREGEGAWGLNFISNAMNSWPQTWYEEDGKVVYGSVTEETREFLRYCAELYQEGILDPQVGTREWDDVTALMTGGQFGFAFGAGHTPSWGLINVYSLDSDCMYSGYLVSDENGVVRHKHSDSAEQGMIVVSKECEHPEIAIQIANLYYGVTADELLAQKAAYPEYAEYLDVLKVDNSCKAYNINVKYYTEALTSANLRNAYWNGEITLDDVAATDATVLSQLQTVDQWLNGESTEPAVWAEYTREAEGYSLVPVLNSYEKAEWLTPLFPSTTATMKTNWANLETLEAETFVKIVTGAVDVDEGFDAFVEQWYALGGEQIIAEIAAEMGLE